jgi:hypothetical protein
MYPNFDEILEELSYKVGIVDLTIESHKTQLVKLLRERGIDSAQQLTDRASVVFEYIKEQTKPDKALAARSKESGKLIYFGSKEAKADALKAGTHTDPTQPTKQSEPKQAQKLSGSDFASSAEKDAEPQTPQTSAPQATAEPKKRIINGKDKTLSVESPLEKDEYQKELEPNDADFEIKNQKFANPTPPPPYKLPDSIAENPKFPKRYLKLFERFMNTQPVGNAKKISHYSDFPGGAGKLPAQAGELMTMMGATMDDEQFAEFQKSISSHLTELTSKNLELKKDGTRVVNEKWLKAAANNRKAILKKVAKQFPGYRIGATSWDTKNEVEALGMSSYNNKGYSTDIYLRLENDKGEPLLEEISLKQNLKVNLLNSGTGKFFEWLGKDNVPDNINPQKFAKNERQKLSKFCETNADAIRQFVDSDEELKAAMEEKGMDFDTALSLALKGKGKQRDVLKVLFAGVKALEKQGNGDAKNLIDEMDNDHANYVSESIKAVVTNPTLKEGMLNEIKKEFPLKSVADNEESVALGEYMLDKSTMEKIFGTSDFNEFKEGLISQPGPPPFIAYKVKLGGRVIPIANIDVREDGRNYGGQFKFEMTVNDDFAKEIIKANKEVYG